MNEQKAHIQELINKLTSDTRKLRRYSMICFIVLVVTVYGFLLLRITTLSNQQPTEAEISSQTNASQVPHIDKDVVEQLKSLEDNSVSVQTLFNQARSNPFQ